MSARPVPGARPAKPSVPDATERGDLIAGAFGRAVRQARETQGWSQELLAERAELNRSYLGEVERGHAMPSLVTIAKLAHAFDLSASALLLRCEGEIGADGAA
jgi:transcriptional regulator with XRE-family HTH domain